MADIPLAEPPISAQLAGRAVPMDQLGGFNKLKPIPIEKTSSKTFLKYFTKSLDFKNDNKEIILKKPKSFFGLRK